MRRAEVKDGLGGSDVFDVPVLEEGRRIGVVLQGRPLVLVLHRVLEAVRPEDVVILGLPHVVVVVVVVGQVLGLLAGRGLASLLFRRLRPLAQVDGKVSIFRLRGSPV